MKGFTKRVVAMLLLGVLAAGCLTGCGGGSFTVKGAVTLQDPSGIDYYGGGGAGDQCSGKNGYEDLTGGANVVVKDSKGEQVALGELEIGKLTGDSEDVDTGCRLAFKIPEVSGDGSIFSITIGSRKDYSFNKDEASDLQLSIGG